jgi:hypothetical protein
MPSPRRYFIHDYGLKLSINVVFTVGHYTQGSDDAGGLTWHVYLLLLLAASMCLQVCTRPFIAQHDDVLSIVVLLSLAIAVRCARAAPAGPGRRCHSARSLTVIDYYPLGI